MCKQLQQRSVPRYHSVRKNEILKECTKSEIFVPNPNPCLILALPSSKICVLRTLFNLKGIFLLHHEI